MLKRPEINMLLMQCVCAITFFIDTNDYFQVDTLQDKGYYEFDYNIKCPVTYCPCFNQNTIVTPTTEMGNNSQPKRSVMVHPGSKLEHKIDHWYCGILKNSSWMHLSFLNNTFERVCGAMRKSHYIYVGFLIKNMHFMDLSQYWKLYDVEHVLEINKKNDIPRQIWIDILITWLQYKKPEKNEMELLWDIIRRQKEGCYHMKTIEACLRDSGYNSIDKYPTTKNSDDMEQIIWIKVSKAKQQKLAKNGEIKLECIMMEGSTIGFLASKKKCSKNRLEITINLTDSVPALETNGYFTQLNVRREFEIKHWFGVTKSLRRMQFLSFYMYNRSQLMQIWNKSNTLWLGFAL